MVTVHDLSMMREEVRLYIHTSPISRGLLYKSYVINLNLYLPLSAFSSMAIFSG